MMRRAASACVLSAGLIAAPLAFAQTAAVDSATAEVLFDQALKLMEAGKAAQACPKLEESQRLDPGVGTLLYLADCYQQVGRTASAWATFREAAYSAKAAGQPDREAIASEYAERLKPKLGYMVIEVANAGEGLQISRDGQSVGNALWGTPMPIDPGKHVVEVSAPGKQPWRAEVDVPAQPGVTTVTIPALENVPQAAPAPVPVAAPPVPQPAAATPAPDPAREPVKPRSAATNPPRDDVRADSGGFAYGTWGWVLGGAGVASLATSAVFSLGARADDEQANEYCRPDNSGLCGDQGVALSEEASKKATLATITGGVGLALLATGVTFLLIAPDDDEPAQTAKGLRFEPNLDFDRAGLDVKGVW